MKLTKRKAFNFYRSYYDVYNELSDKDKVLFMNALLDRQFLGKEPTNLKGMVKFAYISQTNSIDAQVKGYETKTGTNLCDSNESEGATVGGTQGGTQPPSVQEKGKGKGKEKEQYVIPPYEIFLAHAISKIPSIDKQAVKLKYDSWIENDWKDGNDRQIKNWKAKLTNTVGFLPSSGTKKIDIDKIINQNVL